MPVLPFNVQTELANMGERFNAVELMPLTVEVRLVPLNDSELLFTIDAVAALPFAVLVITFAELDKVFVEAAATPADKFKPVDATPLTVDVNVDPDTVKVLVLTAGAVDVIPLMEEVIVFTGLVSALLLIIDTPVAAIPFTVVVSVLVELVLPMVLMIGAVATLPFAVLVIIFAELVNVLVEAAATPAVKLKPADATPLTVDVNVDPDTVKVFVLTAGAVDVIPLMEEVIVFTGLVKALLLIIDTPVAAIPFTVVVSVLVELVFPMVFTIDAVATLPFAVLVITFAELVRVLVEAAATPAVKFKPADATPLTVEVNVDPDTDKLFVLTAGAVDVIPLTEEVIVFTGLVKALLLIIGTPVAAIPFTVVVNVLAELVLPIVFTIGAEAAIPLVVLVRVFTLLPNVLVVALTVPVASLVHTGDAAVPVFTLNALSVVL